MWPCAFAAHRFCSAIFTCWRGLEILCSRPGGWLEGRRPITPRGPKILKIQANSLNLMHFMGHTTTSQQRQFSAILPTVRSFASRTGRTSTRGGKTEEPSEAHASSFKKMLGSSSLECTHEETAKSLQHLVHTGTPNLIAIVVDLRCIVRGWTAKTLCQCTRGQGTPTSRAQTNHIYGGHFVVFFLVTGRHGHQIRQLSPAASYPCPLLGQV